MKSSGLQHSEFQHSEKGKAHTGAMDMDDTH